MNILQKIEKIAADNNSEFLISGSQKWKRFYGKTLDNPYKIIACGNNTELFNYLLTKMVQDKENCKWYHSTLYGYKATYIADEFRLEIETNFNGYDTICVYKESK